MEPEKRFSNLTGQIKMLLISVIAIFGIVYILVANFKKLGEQKGQQVSVNKLSSLNYMIDEESGGMMTLFPLHFFGFFNKNDVIDRMSCLYYNDTELCFE
jgi:hypothetical protein